MPSQIISTFSKKSGLSKKEVEEKWNKAKDITKKEYPDVKEDDDKFYKITVGILKKMIGIKENTVSGDISTTVEPIGVKSRMLPFGIFLKKEKRKKKKELK